MRVLVQGRRRRSSHMAHRGRERSLNAYARLHMFRGAEGYRAHVPAAHGRTAKAMQFMAMALLSHVTRERSRGRGTRYRGVSRAGAARQCGPPTSAARTEPRAVVRSTLPDAATAAPARVRTVLPTRLRTAVRMPVIGEAVTGDGRSAGATGRGDARRRRSRRGRARRGAPSRASAEVRRAVHGIRCGAARAAAPDGDGGNGRAAPAFAGTARRRAGLRPRFSARGYRAARPSRRGCR